MRKFIIAIFLLSQIIFAQSADKDFDEANALYRAEKFDLAAKKYESIVSQEKKHSSELYFNLANSYYKLNKIAPAIYNYEKALLIDPANDDARNNLVFAQKMMIDEFQEVQPAGFGEIVKSFTSIMDYDTWAWIAVFSAFAFLLCFCGYYFSATTLMKRIFFIAMTFAAVIILLTVVSAVLEKQRQKSDRPAIIFDGIVAVKGEPKQNASDAAVIHEGTKVHVLESLENWNHVRLPDGSDGWIPAAAMIELK